MELRFANKHKGQGLETETHQQRVVVFDQLKSTKKSFFCRLCLCRLTKDFWIRYWLAAGSINPDTDVKVNSRSAAQTVANVEDRDDGRFQYRRSLALSNCKTMLASWQY